MTTSAPMADYNGVLSTIGPDEFETLFNEEADILAEQIGLEVVRFQKANTIAAANTAHQNIEKIKRKLNRLTAVLSLSRVSFHLQHRLDRVIGSRSQMGTLLVGCVLCSLHATPRPMAEGSARSMHTAVLPRPLSVEQVLKLDQLVTTYLGTLGYTKNTTLRPEEAGILHTKLLELYITL